MEGLDKVTSEKWILPYLSLGQRGKDIKVEMSTLIDAILHKLKTGCQWRQLPVKPFFDDQTLTWQGVYYHFNEWRKDGSWKRVWLNVLRLNKRFLDLSSLQLDGWHTPAKKGGQAVGYQGRKAAKTTTSLFLADNTGLMLACATPQAGNHHDLFEIQKLFEELCLLLESANINLKDLFLNADSEFDAQNLRLSCANRASNANSGVNPRSANEPAIEWGYFDEELYKRRSVLEHAKAWLDSFKTLLVRYETNVENWLWFHWLAFVVLFLRRINRKKKS
ncbi:transposase [Spirosoma aureum]|uniref:Transposase n=1 Tax=Spirosoma aureum TaxID=2692134 RepID=A0A6G9AXY0_9BACT|nr:transposase [Spirosoma aureum]QIP17145.1 transposase [Spirosoma aureum]